LANVATQSAAVNVSVRNESGAVIGSSTLPLVAQGHTSFMLNQQFPITAGQRGTVRFDTPDAGRISVVGLRANGPALTTLPSFAGVGGQGGLIAHTAFHGGYTSIFQLVNTGNTEASFTLGFFDEAGGPQMVPLRVVQTGLAATATTLTQTLAPGALLVVETISQDNLPVVVGSAQLTTSGNISAFEIFRWSLFGQEASVPVESGTSGNLLLEFDEASDLQTGVALTNGSISATDVTMIVRDQTGAVLGSTVVSLSGRGHTSFMLRNRFPVVAGGRGTVELAVPPGSPFSAIGLRGGPDGTLTTIPVMTN
jgi:hypothetical protein